MDEQRAWIKSRRRKRLRIVAVALCVCLLVTTRPDILAALSTLASEWKDSTVYVSGFGELPEEVRAQTVPVGTGVEELSLPDTLEAFAETPEEEDKPGDADKPGDGSGETGNPDDGEGGTENPGDGNGETGNPDDGGDGTENPGDGNGETGNPGDGEGGTENPGDGNGETGNPGDGEGDTENPGDGNGETGNLGGGEDGTENPADGSGDAGNPGEGTDDGSSDAGNADEGNSGEGEPETQNDSAPAEAEGGAEAADEVVKGADGVLTVQRGVFVMPVYLSEPVDAAEPQTMEKKEESVMIKGVTWQSEPAYDGNVEGTYVFTAILPEGYALADGVSLPQITVTVQGTDPLVQELLTRIAALPEAEDYLADEPDVEEEEEYEAWMDGLSTYTAEALDLWEMYETLTEEQRAQVPTEALVKLAAWVELAGQLAESSQVMAAADGWQAIENSNLEWQLAADGTLTIRGSGAMPDWSNNSNYAPWYDSSGSIKSVVIENSVTKIGTWAFYQCVNLSKVTIPDSVKAIGGRAFYRCTALESVRIPEGVQTIEQAVFEGCSGLISVEIPGSVTSISFNAFFGCALTSVEIPGSVTSISYDAFNSCAELSSVKFIEGANIPTLGERCFQGCPCVAEGTKGLDIPSCKYLTAAGWSKYQNNVTESHNLTKTSAKDATCTEAGIRTEYWECSGCNTKFSDAAGTMVITAPVTIPATGHNLTYKASGQTIVESCTNGCGHSSQAGFTLKDAVAVPCTYTGSELKPFIITRWESWSGTMPSISYENNVNVGTATATLSVPDESVSVSKTFTIVPKSLEDDSVTVSLDTNSPTYTGSAITPTVIMYDDGRRLTVGTDYTVSYQNNTEVGPATVTITGKGNYTGTLTKNFTIYAITLVGAEVTLDNDSYQYTGLPIEPTVTKVIVKGRTLMEGTDYTVGYDNNINAGDAQVIITGTGSYRSTIKKSFTITAKPLTDATVTAAMLSDSHQYSGTGIEPTVTVRDSAIGSGGSELVKGRDYTVSCQNNKDVSTDTNKAQIILTGMGNYAGTLTETFTITAKPLTDASVEVRLDKESYQYTGNEIKPVVTARDSAIGGGTTLVEDRDYTVTYADNIAVGTNTAKVTVTGTGNYTGVRTLTFTIQDKAPEVSGDDLDFSGGTVELPDDIKDKVEKGEVEIYDSKGNKITPNPDGSLPVEPGTTIKIKYPGSDKETVIQIPPRPAAPVAKKVTVTDTTVTVSNPAVGEEYVLVAREGTPDWSKAQADTTFTGLTPNTAYDLYVRKQATKDSFASEPAKTQIRTTVALPTPGGEGADKSGNKVTEGEPNADGSEVTYTGTCTKDYTPVITIDGKTYPPEITWNGDGTGTWTVTVPASGGEPKVNFNDRGYKGLKIEPDSLRIYADDTANQSAEKLLDYLKAHCTIKLAYDNGTSDDATNGAVYTVNGDFNAKGAVYKYAVEAGGDTSKTSAITLTVNPVHVDVKKPDALTRTKQSGGYTKAEVDAWLPASVAVTYTGDGDYAQRMESRSVTWDTDALGADFGAAAGSKTISGTVDLPVWATEGNTGNKTSIGIEFVDRSTLTDTQMNLSISGWAYGAQTAPAPKGSVTVTDTEQTYSYRYSADNGKSWVAADGLPKSGSGNIIPGDYQVEMTYSGRNYTGTKTAAFTVVQKPVTAEKGTLAVENRNYDGTTKATLKAGGKPALVGAVAGDDVSLSGTLNVVFTNKGPKKDIPVTVTGFALTGRDAGYYKLVNTTLTLKATINNKDGSSPSSGSSSGSSGNTSGGDSGNGDNGNSGGDSGNSGNTGTGGSTGSGGNSGTGSAGTGGNKGTGGNTGGNGGTTGSGGTGTGSTGSTGKGSTGSGNIGSNGKGSTGNGNTTGTGKGGTSGTGKGSAGGTGKGTSGNGSGSTAGNSMIGNGGTIGSGKDSTGSGSGTGGSTDSGTGNGDAGEQQTKSVTVQTVQATADDGRIVISGETEAPVAIGTLTEDAPGATRLLVGEGTVTVTVVCEDDQYTVGMNDATAVANAVLTPEQIQRVDAGESLEIRVDIKNISQSIPPQDRETVEKGYEAYGKYIPELMRGGYVDISVYMKTGEGGWNAVSETMEPLEVVIGIPEELRGDGREYYIIRAHEGRYTLLNDMDAVPETITIVTELFSSYAIAYREAGGANAGNGGTAYGLSQASPKFLGIVSLIWLTAAVAGIIVVIIVLRRKKSCKNDCKTVQCK